MSKHLFKAVLVAAALVAGCAEVGAGRGHSVSSQAKGSAAGPAAAVPGKGIRMAGGYYEGAMRNGVPEGEGTFRYDDGRRYDGMFSGGRFNGAGRMTYPDGRRVVAQFRDDYEVSGTITFADGRVYEGQLLKGIPQGKGTLTMRDGGSLTGAFQNGRAEGRALQTRPDGSSFFGPFSGGVAQGAGLCSGPGGASVCSRSGQADTTAQGLRQLAEQRVAQQMEDAARSAREALERDAAARRRPMEQERDTLQLERRKARGPQDDPECRCAIAEACITVGNANDKTPPEVYRLERERRVLMCRSKYADWLQIRQDPDLGKRLAEVDRKLQGVHQRLQQEAQERNRQQRELEAQLARQKADIAARDRLRQAEQDKEEAERRRKTEEARQRCGDPAVRRANPCRCATLLKQPLSKGGVCEA